MTLELTPLEETDIPGVITLISETMSPTEGAWADITMRRHCALRANDIDDGRLYFIARKETRMAGVVGLHHYEWGPQKNVWLGWFAVANANQNSGIGSQMLRHVERLAANHGYTKLLIETYSSTHFDQARKFYMKRGFIPSGIISNYVEDGVDMIVYSKPI